MNRNLRSIRPYSKSQLAALYEVSNRTFYTLIKPFEELIGKKVGKYYTVRQVELIFECLGLPPCLLPDEFIILPLSTIYTKRS